MGVEVSIRKGREGNRWYNERPSAEDVTKWFKEAVTLPEGLKAEDYIGGVVLISGKEKSQEPRGFNEQTGFPIFTEVENLVFTPYVKVETRVALFHDLMRQKEGEWLGVIEPVTPEKPQANLPPGFSIMKVQDGDKVTTFLTCTMKVTVFKRSTVQWRTLRNQRTGEATLVREGETLIDPAPATKMVPIKGRFGADIHSLEKAETGAVGRALGMAGMLILPGTGVATAEDMREAGEQEGVSSVAREEAPPSPEGRAALDASTEPTHDELVARAESLIGQLKKRDEPTFTLFLAWCKESGYQGKVSEMKDADLKVVIRKVERDLEQLDQPAEAAKEEKKS